MISLEDQVAIVTGGSRGIGAATALLFAKAGANILISYANDEKAAKEVQEEVIALGRKCVILKANVAKAKNAEKIVEKAMQKFGQIDILVNNAGIWTHGEMGKMSEETWNETMEINLNGTFHMINAVVPYMKKRHFGKIISISSTAGQRGEAFHSHYAASKGAIISLTKSLAVELGSYNINVNSVAPGWVDTDMSADALRNQKFAEETRKGIPLGRIPTAEDIAGPILFLASDLARHITGEILNVNGGSVLVG
jgi:3-oxoacyl-[acyl-carrier protein] reductase